VAQLTTLTSKFTISIAEYNELLQLHATNEAASPVTVVV